MTYNENFFIFTEQKVPITYIATVEVNSYFWNRGLYKTSATV